MEIRKLEQPDRPALKRMLRLAFGEGEEWSRTYFDPQKNTRLDPDQVLVATEDGEIRASTTVLPMEVFVDGEPAPMGGVAAVMTDPAYRRRGYARRLLNENIADMRRRGTHLSMLDPFSHQFYRASGWETAYDSILYKLSPAKLPTSDEQRHIRTFRSTDETLLREMLDEKAARHQGCVRRDEGRWRGMIEADSDEHGRDSGIVVFEPDEEGIEGYAVYRISDRDAADGPPRLLFIREMIGASLRAREGLLSFVAAFDPEDFEVHIQTPLGEPLHPYLKDSHVRAEIHPGLMLRIVDVEGALGHLRRSIPEPLTLEVSDDIVPENAGEYTVGDGEARRGASAKRRVRLDVRQLSQLYSGYLTARSLAENGLIRPDSEEALELLERFFPAANPWVFPADHF